VRLLGAAIETDFANSTTDTIYYDYKAHKKAYLKAISSLPRDQAETLKTSFAQWEKFEKNVNSPEIIGRPGQHPGE
jgi:hypothetical protein